jgi:hypothetical protein
MYYTVIESNELDDLISEVNTSIENGWQPLGGVSVAINEYVEDNTPKVWMVYAQAMVPASSPR